MNLGALVSWLRGGYDFYKGTIVSTAAGVLLLLGLFIFQTVQSNALTQATLYGDRDLKDIYEMTAKIYAFNQELKGDPFASSGADLTNPIRKLFFAENMGSAIVNPRPPEIAGSVETVHYAVTPEKDRSFTRSQIANFLQRLENSTTRARVTGIKLTPPASAKGIVPGQRREDEWTGEMRITARRRVEKTK